MISIKVWTCLFSFTYYVKNSYTMIAHTYKYSLVHNMVNWDMSCKTNANKYLHEDQNKMDDSMLNTTWENDNFDVFLLNEYRKMFQFKMHLWPALGYDFNFHDIFII